MKSANKLKISKGVIVILLLVSAVICERINTVNILRTSTGVFIGLIRSSIYIALFTAWGISVQYRIVSKSIKKYLRIVALMLVIWMFIRTVKYYFVADPNVNRLLWYLYYIPMLFIPLFSVFISVSIGKPENFRMSRWSLLWTLFTLALVGFVLTNDFHQLVFTFPEGASVFTDGNYDYAVGYYLVIWWDILCALTALGIMLFKCRLPKSRRILWMPYIPTAVAIAYGFLYSTGNPYILNLIPDITVFQCIAFACIFEGCISCGLIQSNTHYKELLAMYEFPVYITDKEYHVYMASDASAELPEKITAQVNEWPIMLENNNIRLSASDIRGGHVIWAEDVSEITNVISELRDINESLKERNAIIQEEYRTKKQKTRLIEANRLYYQMQNETAPQLAKMQILISKLSKENDAEKEKILVSELTMLGAYFKRRNNLLFIAETQQTIRWEEFGYCLKESISALELQGVSGSYMVENQGNVSLSYITQLYDAFQSVLQETFSYLSAIAVLIKNTKCGCEMTIHLHTKFDNSFQFNNCFEVEQEEKNEYLLTYSVQRRDGEK